MAKIEEHTARMLRSMFDDKIKIHPVHNLGNRAILMDAFDLDDEQVDVLHGLAMWICDHDLERAIGMEGPDTRQFLRQLQQDQVQAAFDRLRGIMYAQKFDQEVWDGLVDTLQILARLGASPPKG